MGVKVANNAYGLLASGVSDQDTTLILEQGDGARFPVLGVGDYFYGTLVDVANNLEVVKVTAKAQDTMVIERGADGSTARAYDAGDRFELRPTAAMFEAFTKAESQSFDPTNVSFNANTVQTAIEELDDMAAGALDENGVKTIIENEADKVSGSILITSSQSWVAPRDGDFLITVIGGGGAGVKPPSGGGGSGGNGGGRGEKRTGVVSLDKGEVVTVVIGGSGSASSFKGISAGTLPSGIRGGGGSSVVVDGAAADFLGGSSGTTNGSYGGGGGGSGGYISDAVSASNGSKGGDTAPGSPGTGGAGGTGYGAGGGGGGRGLSSSGAGGAGAPGCVLIQW